MNQTNLCTTLFNLEEWQVSQSELDGIILIQFTVDIGSKMSYRGASVVMDLCDILCSVVNNLNIYIYIYVSYRIRWEFEKIILQRHQGCLPGLCRL